MALYSQMYEVCQKLEKESVPDGEGGFESRWVPVRGFEAAVVLDSSTEAVLAASAGMNRSYRVTSPIGTNLGFHDVFQRVSDGKTFRVVSDPTDIQTPAVATFQFEIVKAEAWEVPDE